jgi:hypothetical protein
MTCGTHSTCRKCRKPDDSCSCNDVKPVVKPTVKWVANDEGIDTEDGETVLCHQYDWTTGETTMFYSKRFKPALLAVPELLEALQGCIAELEQLDKCYTTRLDEEGSARLAKAQAALTKATKL